MARCVDSFPTRTKSPRVSNHSPDEPDRGYTAATRWASVRSSGEYQFT